MIRLTFTPPVGSVTWDSWVATAEAAREALLESPPELRKIRDRIYKGGRDFLLAATYKKCAYCETFLPPQERKGDVEHFRPKGGVRDAEGKIVHVVSAGVSARHPGYFWLAYEYSNLLPVCGACNRRARDEREGRITGKGEIFPTLNGWYASTPDEVVQEQPVLLNPWLETDDPADHFLFDPSTGLTIGKTERGRGAVEILGLNRDGLPEERKKTCRDVEKAVLAGVNAILLHATIDPDYVAMSDAVRDGSAEYAAFCRVHLAGTRSALMMALNKPR